MNIFKVVFIVVVVMFIGRNIVNTAQADCLFDCPSVFDFADNDTMLSRRLTVTLLSSMMMS